MLTLHDDVAELSGEIKHPMLDAAVVPSSLKLLPMRLNECYGCLDLRRNVVLKTSYLYVESWHGRLAT